MENEKPYSIYSDQNLLNALKNLDREKNPENYSLLLKEIENRKLDLNSDRGSNFKITKKKSKKIWIISVFVVFFAIVSVYSITYFRLSKIVQEKFPWLKSYSSQINHDLGESAEIKIKSALKIYGTQYNWRIGDIDSEMLAIDDGDPFYIKIIFKINNDELENKQATEELARKAYQNTLPLFTKQNLQNLKLYLTGNSDAHGEYKVVSFEWKAEDVLRSLRAK